MLPGVSDDQHAVFGSDLDQTYPEWLLGWLVKSQLVIHSPASRIEYFGLPRLKHSKVMGVAAVPFARPKKMRRNHWTKLWVLSVDVVQHPDAARHLLQR